MDNPDNERLGTALTVLSSSVFQKFDDLCYDAGAPALDVCDWEESELSERLAAEGDATSIFDSVRITQIEAFAIQTLALSSSAPEGFVNACRAIFPTPALQGDNMDDYKTSPYAFNALLQEAYEAGILKVDPREMNLMLPCPKPSPECAPPRAESTPSI
ncbi:hypothetical protein AA14337_2938 [Acetobacter malorum DSM 14337]|uniref:Uncharacterized protein n=1 Tax=Acetobacter malorum DSM 14337 TaxID=1307910 RepID=A0ABQ0PYN5_9PROT|nr:hypothetical protein [Acetobacter malorum]KXV06760.1 hypothetical protein AD930_06575 [Acetobacter malorum]GBQ84881.1 hypothetical protein AA14337_2938 [Acetobacter malorum DSM 14337]